MTKHLPQDERRQQILTAARRCFVQRGYAHTRVDDIAAEAGLSKGGIYFHFSSKREIFDALLAGQLDINLALLEEVSQTSAPLTEKLRTLAQSLLDRFAGLEDQGKFLTVIAEMGLREDDVHATFVRQHEQYVDALTKLIEGGVASGEIREVASPRATALYLKMLVDGFEQAVTIGYDIDVDKFVRNGMELLFYGLRSRD